MPPTNSVYYESNKLVLSVLIPESPGRCLVSSRLLSNISTCPGLSHTRLMVYRAGSARAQTLTPQIFSDHF